MERLAFDIISAILLLLVSLVGSWLPLHLSHQVHAKHSSKDRACSGRTLYHLGNCLSAGVMLGAGFCHLLADSLHNLAFVGRFPMANFLAALGFLLTLAADQLAQVLSGPASPSCHGSHSHNKGSSRRHSRQDLKVELTEKTDKQRGGSEKVPLLAIPLPVSTPGQIAVGHAFNGAYIKSAGSAGNHTRSAAHHSVSSNGSYTNVSGGHSNATGKDVEQEAGSEASDEEAGGMDALLAPSGRHLSFATALLLAAALCVHSILEGMAMGAQKTVHGSQTIMIAIAAHKGLAAYALGSSIVESGANTRRTWTVLLTFSLATPIAIIIGYALSTVSSGIGGDVLSALAVGTFLYVALMEIIPRELSSHSHAHTVLPGGLRAAKMSAIAVGFGAMSVLAIWA